MKRIMERNSVMAAEMLDVETAVAKLLEKFNRLTIARAIDFTVSGDVAGMVRLSANSGARTNSSNRAKSANRANSTQIEKLVMEAFFAGMECTPSGGSMELEFAISDYIRFALRCSGYCDSGVFKGLAGMIEDVKGTLFVESRDLGGTGIHVCIPYSINQGYVL